MTENCHFLKHFKKGMIKKKSPKTLFDIEIIAKILKFILIHCTLNNTISNSINEVTDEIFDQNEVDIFN